MSGGDDDGRVEVWVSGGAVFNWGCPPAESLEEQQDRTHQQLGEAHQGIRFAIVSDL